MCMSNLVINRGLPLAAIVVLTVCFWGRGIAQTPNLGQPVTPAELSAIDFTVMPDGRGLPEGRGNAVDGALLYEKHCRSCHGETGVGGVNDKLVGGQGSLSTAKPIKTIGSYWPYATTLFDYVRRAMPYNAPGSLSNSETYALAAYLLHLNGIVDQHQYLDAQTLAQIKMPNAQGFDWAEHESLDAASGERAGERHE